MKKKIKLVYLLATLNAGGAEKVSLTMLRQLNPEQFDITLILINKVGPFLELVPEYVHIIDLGIKKTLLSIMSLRKVLINIEADIIYSTLFRTHIAIDLAVIAFKKKPKIVLRSPTSPKLLIERGEISFLMRTLITRAYKHADKILAQTPEMKNEIVSYHTIEEDKVVLFINPLDKELINEKIEEAINPFDDKYINIVALGRLSEVKGFDILLKSFAKVQQQNNNFFLNIVGKDGGEEEKLKKICKKLKIETHVKFWGFQSNPYQYFYYSQLFVLSSRREGLPNTVLENLYLKKSIVATKCVPFMSELIEDGVNGYLVDVEDINSLSEAILNYKKLMVEKSEFKSNSYDLNDFFKYL